MEAGTDVNEILTELRLDGTDVIDCILVVRDLYGLTLGEAKRTVLICPAFADEREGFEAFQDGPTKAVERQGRRRRSGRAKG
jgi:hypothetical protein